MRDDPNVGETMDGGKNKLGCIVHVPEIVHLDLEIWTQSTLGHADQLYS